MVIIAMTSDAIQETQEDTCISVRCQQLWQNSKKCKPLEMKNGWKLQHLSQSEHFLQVGKIFIGIYGNCDMSWVDRWRQKLMKLIVC